MLTARPQKNLRVALSYFREHLAVGDHVSEGHKTHGQWFGQGITRLGLEPGAAVTEDAYVHLCRNLHPLTGKRLTVRQRATDRRVFFDFVASAPKSLSVLALVMGDERLVAVHDAACLAAAACLERAAATRVRKNGEIAVRTTGEIVAAVFRHETSRALDPQLHSHLVVFNATWDQAENRWKALEPGSMFEQINFLTEVYRSELAVGLQKLGYRLHSTRHGFEVEGVSREILERFSKRRQDIAHQERRIEASSSRPVDNNVRARLARLTRQRKLKHISPNAVLAAQRAQLEPKELTALRELRQTNKPNRPVSVQTGKLVSAKEAIDFAVSHLFERRTVISRAELFREALKFGQGCLTLPDLEPALTARSDLLMVGNELTTREALKKERHMVTLVQQGRDQCRPLNAAFMGDKRLTDEQRLALQTLLRSSDRVVALRGGAGTGKTFLLKQVVEAIEQRQKVFVVAPTATAVDALRRDGFPQPTTVQLLLCSSALQENVRGNVLLVEEAGLLSCRQMTALLELTQSGRGRLLLVGDTRQHTAVEAGDALRILENEKALRPVQLKSIQRQVKLEYRKAIAEIAQGNSLDALSRLERMGAVHVVEDESRYKRLASDYVESVQSGNSALVVCPTWGEIDQVTDEVRRRLRAHGKLSPTDKILTTHRSLQWTEAQKRDLRLYRPGYVLTFHKATANHAKGDWVEVVSVEPHHLVVARSDGTKARLTGKQQGCFDVASQHELPVAEGEKLLLRSNQQSLGLLNGQIVSVRAVQKDGTIVLEDGRRVPPTFRTFCHGYGVTSHAAQGKTVDDIYLAVNRSSGLAANRNQFYVSASRGRNRIAIYTDDLESLRDAVQRPGTRSSALELVQRAKEQHRRQAEIRQKAHEQANVKI